MTDPFLNRVDDFNGDDQHLVASINALLDLDDHQALVPHGLGGPGSHAYKLLAAASARLSATHTSVDCRLYNALSTAVHTIESNRREIAVLAPKAEAYERLGQVLDLAYDRSLARGRHVSVDPLYDIRQEMEQMEQRMRGEKQAAHEARQASNDRPKGQVGPVADLAGETINPYDQAQPATFSDYWAKDGATRRREPDYPIVPGTYTGHAGSNGGSD